MHSSDFKLRELLMNIQTLKQWFFEHKRDFPWREEHTPYRVWVSEVMLQQTQASVVIPYFMRWMIRFPTIHSLAQAPIEDVIKVWEGLGYYSRARNLHEGAKMIVKDYAGEIPSSADQLKKIKGLGPYTIGAIQCFAFHQKAAAVDGNVIRVITRLLGIDEDMAKVKHQKMLREKVYDLLPDHEPWVISEALIELGATVCKKKALCHQCPMRKNCYAALHNKVDSLPVKLKNTRYTTLHRSVVIIFCDDSVLLRKGNKGEIMEGLYEFPYFENHFADSIVQEVQNQLSLKVNLESVLPKESHSFTRYRVHLYPVICHAENQSRVDGHQWQQIKKLPLLPFSSGHKRVLISAIPITNEDSGFWHG
jgi:A/G-specific adenine glycosylase